MRAAASIAALALAGCFGDEATVFPPGLEPLEANTAPPIQPLDGDPYPEVMSLVTGERPELYFGHARAYVKADLITTWRALRQPEVSVDRRQVDEFMIEEGGEPSYAFSYVVHNVVRRIVTLKFDVAWRHDVARGSVEEPELVAGAWQKTFGSTLIPVLRGSLVAHQVDSEVTEIEWVQQLDAVQGGADPIASFLTDYYESIKAVVHGQPIPEY